MMLFALGVLVGFGLALYLGYRHNRAAEIKPPQQRIDVPALVALMEAEQARAPRIMHYGILRSDWDRRAH